MKNIFSKPISKAIVDILLVTGIFISIISSRSDGRASWGSFHCIVSMAWYALMLVHIWQHWRLIKACVKPKVMKRNKITLMTIIVFVLMSFSIILFVVDVSEKFIRIHHGISHLFWLVMIVHTIQKTKRFVRLFKKDVFLPNKYINLK
jgi:hypothetical protein